MAADSRRYRIGVAVVLLLTGLLGPAVTAPPAAHAAADTWATKAPMPTARFWLGVAAASNGKLYAVGGTGSQPTLTTVEEYDPTSNTWTAKAPMPTTRTHLGVAGAPNGKLYAIGGAVCSNPTCSLIFGRSAAVEEYDPATNTWTARTPMPTARSQLGLAAAPNGKLYAIGGKGAGVPPLPTVEEYDPATNSWATRAPMPTARWGIGLVAATNGKLYAIGGTAETSGSIFEPVATVEEYDPATNTWAPKAPMSGVRDGHGVAAVPTGKLYAIGGSGAITSVATVEEYDPAINTWRSRASMPAARTGLGVAAAPNQKLYAIGGEGCLNPPTCTSFGALATVEEYEPLWWAQRAGLVVGRAGLGLTWSTNGKLYAVGGLGLGDAVLPTVEEYDPTTNIWISRASMPTARFGLALAAAPSGKLYAIGGATNSTLPRPVTTVEEYDPATNTWTAKAPLPTARTRLGVAAAPNGKLYAIGGFGCGNPLCTLFPAVATVEEYDPATNTWTAKAAMSTARGGLGVAAAPNGKLYAVGGFGCLNPPTCSSSGPLSAVEEYDPGTNTWAGKSLLPTSRYQLGVAAAFNGKLYAVGGASATSSYVPTVEEYDLATNSWREQQPMVMARSGLAVALAANGKLYAVGGASTDPLGWVEEFFLPDSGPMTCIPRPPVQVSVAPNGAGRLLATLSAQSTFTTPANVIRTVQFTSAPGAQVQTASGSPLAVPGTVQPGGASYSFQVVRAGSGAGTVFLKVTDSCPAWDTFVGAGASGFPTSAPGQPAAPPAEPPPILPSPSPGPSASSASAAATPSGSPSAPATSLAPAAASVSASPSVPAPAPSGRAPLPAGPASALAPGASRVLGPPWAAAPGGVGSWSGGLGPGGAWRVGGPVPPPWWWPQAPPTMQPLPALGGLWPPPLYVPAPLGPLAEPAPLTESLHDP